MSPGSPPSAVSTQILMCLFSLGEEHPPTPVYPSPAAEGGPHGEHLVARGSDCQMRVWHSFCVSSRGHQGPGWINRPKPCKPYSENR